MIPVALSWWYAMRRAHCGRLTAFTACAVVLCATGAPQALAQAPVAQVAAAPALTADELEALVGRIALYPDDLVALVLPASTQPLQVVQADRFLEKRKADPKAPVDERWDDSIKSLLNYPEVIKSMSSDLDWTAALGEAVVADQGDVLEAIQAFRRKTQAAGNLQSDARQVVVVEKEVVKIVPADPQVIYVPQYNPTTVVVQGGPTWGYYPTPYPVYYYPYPPGAAFATGLIWGAAINSAWNGGRYATHYGGDANININRTTNINTGDINRNNTNINRSGTAQQQPAGGSSQWKSSKQPGQVSSSVGTTQSARVGDNRAAASGSAARPTAAPRPSTQPAARSVAGGAAPSQQVAGGGGGGSAFDGYGSGRQTQMDSSRGAASRGSAQRSSARGGGGGRR